MELGGINAKSRPVAGTDRLDLARVFWLVLFGAALVGVLFRVYVYATHWDDVLILVGDTDHLIYRFQAERFLAGGPMYRAWQTDAPYELTQVPVPELYPPPTVLFLIVPMSLLPEPVWWILPLSIIAGVLAYHRPSIKGWALILSMLALPITFDQIASGGLLMYVAAALALGTIRPNLYPLALLKPSVFPFALLGIRDRGWWITLGCIGVVSLFMIPWWIDYAKVMLNLRGGGLLYSLPNVPFLLIPLIGWFSGARRYRSSSRPSSS